MVQKIISQGAEAKIFLNKDWVTKDRTPKSYRLKELDDKIRKRRTKAEAKLLTKVSKIINAPVPENHDDFDKIKIPFIKGKKLSDFLDSFPLKKQKEICKQIGKDLAKLHDENIIHGDLTTSNLIFTENKKPYPVKNLRKSVSEANQIGKAKGLGGRDNSKPIIFFIDFGLGFFNGKYEDKAVDIHLFKQALEAKHFKNFKALFKSFEQGYRSSKNSKIIFQRLKAVEKRGRYRH